MTLEQEAFRMRGGFGARMSPRPPRFSDWLARVVAVVLLAIIAGAALAVLYFYFLPGFLVAVASVWLLLAAALSRMRELGHRLAAVEREVAELRSAAAPTPPPEEPDQPGGEEQGRGADAAPDP